MDDDKVPCCALDQAKKVKKIFINGTPIGIAKLDEIIYEVFELDLEDEEEIKNELLKRIRKNNYVPQSAEDEYKNAAYVVYTSSVSVLLDKRQ